MHLYDTVANQLSRQLTERYSTSFSMSSRLFARDIRPHIYAIYGLVRIADEIVDTYMGDDQVEVLDALEFELDQAMPRRYSANPIIHTFVQTAVTFGITRAETAPFFASMRMDADESYTVDRYDEYIYGSAVVVGLMCLRVFVGDNTDRYHSLRPGAEALARAYQKVNFLRDIRDDYERLGRMYFPGAHYDTLSDDDIARIVSDIQHEFDQAVTSVNDLPQSARRAVTASVYYYRQLLDQLRTMTPDEIRQTRASVPAVVKLWLLLRAAIGGRV